MSNRLDSAAVTQYSGGMTTNKLYWTAGSRCSKYQAGRGCLGHLKEAEVNGGRNVLVCSKCEAGHGLASTCSKPSDRSCCS